MKKNLKNKKSLNIAMLGHKRIPSREGGIEIVVEELATRMVTLGHIVGGVPAKKIGVNIEHKLYINTKNNEEIL